MKPRISSTDKHGYARKAVNILGIETSCDETAASVVKDGHILSNVVASQVKLHAKTGGVVPEVAARAHVERILPVISEALSKAKLETIRDVDAIAVTVGPGLLGSLIVGSETAKTLGYVFNKPVLAINHLEGHLVSALAETMPNSKFLIPNSIFPAIALVVSGGHTELVLVKNLFDYKVIGQTRDDAAGEAFDKIAKLLDLPYPGGPALAKLAKKGNSKAFDFPRGMLEQDNFDFSFSGLKTAVLYFLRKHSRVSKADVAASVQEAIVDVLVEKTLAAARRFGVKTILLGGGVIANKELRKRFASLTTNYLLLTTPVALATDNAAMIALAGYWRFMAGERGNWYDVRVNPNLNLE